jgi:site-specific DNA recombinase
MSPSEASQGGRRWRYYVSQAILQGRKQDAGSIPRVSAPEVERTVLDAVRAAIGDERSNDANIRTGVERVTIRQAGLLIRLSDQMLEDQGNQTISLPWTPTPSRRRREIFQGDGETQLTFGRCALRLGEPSAPPIEELDFGSIA